MAGESRPPRRTCSVADDGTREPRREEAPAQGARPAHVVSFRIWGSSPGQNFRRGPFTQAHRPSTLLHPLAMSHVVELPVVAPPTPAGWAPPPPPPARASPVSLALSPEAEKIIAHTSFPQLWSNASSSPQVRRTSRTSSAPCTSSRLRNTISTPRRRGNASRH